MMVGSVVGCVGYCIVKMVVNFGCCDCFGCGRNCCNCHCCNCVVKKIENLVGIVFGCVDLNFGVGWGNCWCGGLVVDSECSKGGCCCGF